MQVNDILHGFQVRQIRELPELCAKLVRMEYLKNGADLVWLDREDDNKTFAITFKTIPQDDTGVFHILEHSVLCGSEKYPVKEPFVELLKSSMNTFLNAFTFPDKTMYPVSSRNDQDFLNLMDVYLDATLHPLSISGPHAFRQEGWHYELEAPEGELTVNGVVYNEMKGAYASPDTVAMGEMNRLLFPDNCYGFESGGHPAHIPELTYENYLASHRRFYHPSNSRIFLDGSVDLDSVLGKIDSFLSAFDRLEPDSDIPMQAPVAPPELCVPYAVGPEEDEAGKGLYAQGWVVGRFDETEKLQGFSALTDVLCGSNDAPLKKALLERGLAADVELYTIDGVQQPYAMLLLRNCADGKEAEIRQCIRGVLEELAEKGLDHEQLKAKLDRMEFAAREKDFGSMPKGLAFAVLAQQGWLYGGDPAQYLCVFKVFPALREKVDQGWFEALLRELLLDNPHQAALRLLPSKTLAAENQSREAARLKALKESWTREQTRDTVESFARFRELQGTPDTPEQKASLPLLSLSDIPEEPRQLRQAVEKAGDVTVLHQDLETDGIVYLDLYFSLADMPAETLAPLSFLTHLLGKLGTERFGALELSARIDRTLGAFRAGTAVIGKKASPAACTPMLTVSLSVLESKKAEALALLDEILNRTVYTDAAQIANLLRQQRLEKEQTVIMSGNSFAVMRVGAAFTAAGAVGEQLSGISYLRWLQEQDKRLAGGDSGLCGELAGLSGKLFHSSRLTVSVTGALDRAWVDSLLALFPAAPMGAPAAYALAPVSREGFQIPAEIGFAAKATHLSRVSGVKDGVWQVASQFLTYDYLWNEVRVKGGAYGTGFRVSRGGDLSLHSFRDPSPAQSLVTFDGAAEALRRLCAGGEDLTKYIISTVARQDPVLSARAEGALSATMYLRGEGAEDRRRLHSEILHATPEQLLQAADALDALKDQFGVCVIGGQKVLEACAGALDTVEALQ